MYWLINQRILYQKKITVPVISTIIWKVKYPLNFSVNLLHSSMNQELFIFCNQKNTKKLQ